ncbi:MAG: DUF2851 family protein [Mangrovibacterium sp.]
MNELFLQFIWKHRLFDHRKLSTHDGQQVKVLSPGIINQDAGPDFFNARIQIGTTVWAGNVEIHQRASEWNRHQHNRDAAYDNVILHVIGQDDQQVLNSKGHPVPSMVLPYDSYLEANYQELIKANGWIACQNQFHQIELLSLQIWFHGLMVERLQQKTAEVIQRLEQNNHDWNETFYQFLARNFGFKTNALPFELLARSLPLHLAERHKDSLFQLEALFFGTAGLLNEELIGDDYFLALKKEFSFLYKKYRLNPVPVHLWKFLRLRPVNFPTVRIAQFARLFYQSAALFSQLVEMKDLAKIKDIFTIQPSDYWTSHYRFNKPSPESPKHLGASAFHNIVINTFVPFLFVYGDYYHKQELKDLALDFLAKIPPEENSVIDHWEKMGVPVRSAFESQALLQLKNNYCNFRKCLNCPVGTKLISKYSGRPETGIRTPAG